MSEARLSIGEVSLSFALGGVGEERAGRISRLIFEHVGELTARGLAPFDGDVEVGALAVSVRVPSAAIEDEELARACAAEIVRALALRA
ncbi:MAG: hypothetical protein ABW250_04445 [Pyrinomonadaceae bacterium]